MFEIRLLVLTGLVVATSVFAATTTQANYQPATQIAMPPPAISTPKVVGPKSSQLLRPHYSIKTLSGTSAVQRANKKAIVLPSSAETVNSIIVYNYQPGDLYEIYGSPLNVTDVQFQPGEQIISVAAGDTMRWEISKTVSGSDSSRTEHLLIKPLDEDLNTTMVVTTNWRTYHLLLDSTHKTFMAGVEWQYANQDMMMQTADGNVSNNNPTDIPVDLSKLDFSYKLKLVRGDKPDWLPLSIFNDGTKTYIEFPQNIQSAPTLFIKQSGSGDAAVNYRVMGNYYVVDQVFTGAELVAGNGQTIVEILYGK